MAYDEPVSFWEKVKDVFTREAEDVKDGLQDLGETLDDALAKKERELAADPAERFDMMLEDVEAANERLDQLVDDPSGAAAEMQHRPAAPHQLLEAADVSSSPHLATAMTWVTVEATQDTDPMAGTCGHAAWIEQRAAVLVTADLVNIAKAVSEHPLVAKVEPGDADVLYVEAAALHHEDVRLLVAAAMAERLPAGWRTKTPPDLSV